MSEDSIWITVNRAAELSGLSPRTIRNNLTAGKLCGKPGEVMRVGRAWLLRLDAFAAAMAEEDAPRVRRTWGKVEAGKKVAR